MPLARNRCVCLRPLGFLFCQMVFATPFRWRPSTIKRLKGLTGQTLLFLYGTVGGLGVGTRARRLNDLKLSVVAHARNLGTWEARQEDLRKTGANLAS